MFSVGKVSSASFTISTVVVLVVQSLLSDFFVLFWPFVLRFGFFLKISSSEAVLSNFWFSFWAERDIQNDMRVGILRLNQLDGSQAGQHEAPNLMNKVPSQFNCLLGLEIQKMIFMCNVFFYSVCERASVFKMLLCICIVRGRLLYKEIVFALCQEVEFFHKIPSHGNFPWSVLKEKPIFLVL